MILNNMISILIENQKMLVNVLSAWLTPIIAIMGIVFVIFQWRTNEKRRQNELFDRRYQFYTRLKESYLSQHASESPIGDFEDWIPYAEEASFLFGKDIESHILSFSDRGLTGSPSFPDEWFIKPFRKYLKL